MGFETLKAIIGILSMSLVFSVPIIGIYLTYIFILHKLSSKYILINR